MLRSDWFIYLFVLNFLCIATRDICLVAEKAEAIEIDFKVVFAFVIVLFWLQILFYLSRSVLGVSVYLTSSR